MREIAIQVNEISKKYKLYGRPSDRIKDSLHLGKVRNVKEKYALDHVTFSVAKGESVGIIGTNGSGKSTVLKIITGVLNPTEGEVKINGRISALLELGAGFNMEYTGIENIYLNGTMIGFTKEEINAKMKDILEFADIGDYVNQPVKTYSSGMFVRLAFAVAINIEPEILIVDEALSVGDVFFQAKCYRKFEEFRDVGKTVVFVSHDLSSVSKYCDRVILLNQGVKLAEGSPKEMVDMYKMLLVNQKESNVSVNKLKQKDTGLWKDQMAVNDRMIEYGDGKAYIVDYGIFDEQGRLTGTIEKGTKFTVKMKVRFQETVEAPIFAFSVKNIKGVEITGTNTMDERVQVSPGKQGIEQTVTFTQTMQLQSGEYLLSFGCTGFQSTDFTVYHRLYDVCSLMVISDKDTVGFFDMDSTITMG